MILQVGMRADDRHLVVCPLYHSGGAGVRRDHDGARRDDRAA